MVVYVFFRTSLDTKPMSLDTKPMSRGVWGITAVARCVWVWLDIKNRCMVCCAVMCMCIFHCFSTSLENKPCPEESGTKTTVARCVDKVEYCE